MNTNKQLNNSFFFVGNRNKWIQPQGYYVHFYNCFDMIFHSHHRIEIMYVVMGELKVAFKSDDNNFETYTLHPNSYVFIDAEVPHKIFVDNIATKIYNIEFSLAETNEANFTFFSLSNKDQSFKNFLLSKKQVLSFVDDGVFLQNFLLLQKYIGDEINKPCDPYLNYLFSAIFILMAQQNDKANKHLHGMRYINKAVNHISQNYTQDFSLPELAEICGISSNYLNTLFMKNFSMTVNNYVNKYRIEHAALLLTNSDLSIDEIFEQVGYHNKINFYQNFIKFMNIPPKQYRQFSRESNIVMRHIKGRENKYWN